MINALPHTFPFAVVGFDIFEASRVVARFGGGQSSDYKRQAQQVHQDLNSIIWWFWTGRKGGGAETSKDFPQQNLYTV